MNTNLENIQKKFENATEKEHWEKLQTLLLSEDKESVVQGISLIEQLEEKRTPNLQGATI